MKRIPYLGEVWASRFQEYHPSLLGLLTSKDCLAVLSHGKPPYKVVLGVPHQAVVGEEFICENGERRKSDENAASYAMVTFTVFKNKRVRSCNNTIETEATFCSRNGSPGRVNRVNSSLLIRHIRIC
jgi:hypothetical protein